MKEKVLKAAKDTGSSFQVIEIDQAFSDTAIFCEKYNFPLSSVVNTILVSSKKEPKLYCACVVLATTTLDVNRKVKQLINSRCSFASAEEMNKLTGMQVGAVTPFGLPPEISIFVDERVFDEESVILGCGERSSKLKISPQAILRLPNSSKIEGLANPKQI